MAEKATKDAVEVAHAMFMLYRDKAEILKESGIKESTYTTHIAEWRKERRERLDRVLAKKLDQAARDGAMLITMAMPVVYHAIKNRADRADIKPISMMEASAIIDMVSKVDKLVRLTGNRPTAIEDTRMHIMDTKLDMNRLLEAMKKDKFIDYIPLKSKEEENELAENNFGQDSIGTQTGNAHGKPKP
jgi:hypothetical protein